MTPTTSRTFDHVVVATHADEALALLAQPTTAEHDVLSAFALLGQRDDPPHRRLVAPAPPPRPGVVELPPVGVQR